MVSESFVQLSIIILVVLGFAAVLRMLKQPLVIAYIIAGIFVGQYFLNIADPSQLSYLESFSTIGIAILLFIVGLHLDPKSVKSSGRASFILGVGQVIFTFVAGLLITRLLGFSWFVASYVSIALTFSSTIIVTKLLSDRGEIDSLHGRLAVGILVVQDIVAALVLMSVSASGGSFTLPLILRTVGVGFSLILGISLIGYYILPWTTQRIARSQEFLLLFSIGWCFVIAALFFVLGFSLEIGALLAGFTLSFTNYRFEIGSRLKPLRDFFLIMFFILLGSQMVFTSVSSMIVPIVVLSLFVLVGNPLIVIILLGQMGYSRKVAFFTGLTIAQISEFSLILLTLAMRVGHLSSDIVSMVTIIGLISFAGSTYMITYAERLYPYFSPFLKVFERKGHHPKDESLEYGDVSTVLFGHDRIGFSLMSSFKKMNEKYLVVDFNPDVIRELTERKIPCLYGDVSDSELLEELKIHKTRLIISTIPYLDTSLLVLEKVRKKNKNGVVIMTANNVHDAVRLYERGADYVLLPHVISGSHAALLIERCHDKRHLYKKERDSQMKYLSAHIERADRLHGRKVKK